MADKMESEAVKLVKLPLSRIKTIMKSSPEVNHAGQESIFMITKATELFVEYLAKAAHKKEEKKDELSYKSLAKVVDAEDCLQFLSDIVPKKVLAKDYLASLKKTQDNKEEVIELE